MLMIQLKGYVFARSGKVYNQFLNRYNRLNFFGEQGTLRIPS